MPTERERRLVLNEALFRAANERAAGWEERHQLEGIELYQCECANVDCREKVPLRRIDYERVREDSTHFFIAPDHEVLDVESVIERHEDWLVVQKNPEVQGIAEATDGRTP
ncbi:MAG: hypothetical protein ACR2G3_00850 [Solirubrobacterales bacterium]